MINVEQARINTVAVEVSTLKISGKQVTLSVFRQIQEEMIIDLTSGDVLGVPWGWVNYLNDGGGINLVWQKDKELRRCHLRPSRFLDYYSQKLQSQSGRMSMVNGDFLAKMRLTQEDGVPVTMLGQSEVYIDLRGRRYKTNEHFYGRPSLRVYSQWSEIRELGHRALIGCFGGRHYYDLAPDTNEEELYKKWVADRVAIESQTRSIEQSRDLVMKTLESFKQLPQLFIAV